MALAVRHHRRQQKGKQNKKGRHLKKSTSGSGRKKTATAGIFGQTNLKTQVSMRKQKLSAEQVSAIKKATAKLSKDDVALLKSVFDEGDVDGTGLLVRDELHIALSSIGIKCNDQELDEYLAFADADGSEAIDMEEWLMLIGLLIQPPFSADELFDAFDLLFESVEGDEEGPLIMTEDFTTILDQVLKLSLNSKEISELPRTLHDLATFADPDNTGSFSCEELVKVLSTPYGEEVEEEEKETFNYYDEDLY